MMRFLTYLGLLSATMLWLGILWAFAQDPATTLPPLPKAGTLRAVQSSMQDRRAVDLARSGSRSR